MSTPLKPPIRSDKLVYVSASQVETYNRCPRLWAYQYIWGERTPPSKSQALGTHIHALFEDYAQTGQMRAVTTDDSIAFNDIVQAGIPFMPKNLPDPAVFVEHEIQMPTHVDGVIWKGYIDLVDLRDGAPAVYDHKTCSDFRYCKTPQELASNVQMVSYGLWALQTKPQEELVELKHLYHRTKGSPKCNPVSIRVTRRHINAEWDKIGETVREMHNLVGSQPASPQDVFPNTDACGAYGGCFFRQRCGITPSLFAFQTPKTNKQQESTMSMSKLRERLEGKMNGTVPLSATSAPAAAATPKAPTQDEQLAKAGFTPAHIKQLKAEDAVQEALDGRITPGIMDRVGKSSPAPAAAPAAPVEVAMAKCGTCKGRKAVKVDGAWKDCADCKGTGVIASKFIPATPSNGHGAAPGAILAPDAPSRVNEVPCQGNCGKGAVRQVQNAAGIFKLCAECEGPKDKPVEAEPKKVKKQTKKAAPAPQVAEATPEPAGAISTPNPPADSPPEVKTQPTSPEAPSATSPVQTSGHPNPTAVVFKTPTGLTLYVDCLPLKGGVPYVLGEEWLKPICEAVAEVNQVLDWRLIQYTSRPALALGIRAAIDGGRLPEAVVVSTALSGSDVLLETLAPHAKNIVRALRG
jgi:RecB family exonuclease